jgi:hypothetical protein
MNRLRAVVRAVFSYRGVVWLSLAAVSWFGLCVLVMLLVLWPQPTGFFLAGFAAATVLWIRVTDTQLVAVEAVSVRKDAAIDGAMQVALSAQELEQRLTAGRPAPAVYDWAGRGCPLGYHIGAALPCDCDPQLAENTPRYAAEFPIDDEFRAFTVEVARRRLPDAPTYRRWLG